MRNCSQKVSIALLVLSWAMSAQAGAGRKDNQTLEVRVESASIQPPVRYEVSRDIGRGRIVKARSGRPGQLRRTYRVNLKKGHPVSKELLKEEITEPDPVVFLIGHGGFDFSRGDFVRHRVLEMVASGYPAMVCGTGITRTGRRAEYGVVAVDPRIIPLGSIVYVEGYGLALACDTGSAIKGHRIDLCYESRSEADAYGMRHVRVHILR
jgi:3D (Asp-Asp-Asp) domain-containing protein